MIATGVFEFVDSRQFVVNAKFALFGQAEGSDQDLLFGFWANEAIREIDCLSIFKKQVKTVTVTDGKAKLPAGFNKFLGLRYNLNNGFGCEDMIYVDRKFITSCGCESTWNWVTDITGTFEIQDGYIYIHTQPLTLNEDGEVVLVQQDVRELVLAYMGLNVDDKGLMRAHAEMERCVSSYICYRYCLQNMDQPKYAAQMQEYRETWKAKKRELKSRDFQDNFRQTRDQVAQWMNALIVDKNTWH